MIKKYPVRLSDCFDCDFFKNDFVSAFLIPIIFRVMVLSAKCDPRDGEMKVRILTGFLEKRERCVANSAYFLQFSR